MDSGQCQTPIHLLPTWMQDVHAAGYLAAMNGHPLNPVAMDVWQLGWNLFHDSRALTSSTSIAA